VRDDPHDEPDAASGRRVRFVCGALLGLLFGLWLHLYVGPFGLLFAVVVATGSATVCGVLAVRYGDAFWHSVMSALR
jgi:hypothetical protein